MGGAVSEEGVISCKGRSQAESRPSIGRMVAQASKALGGLRIWRGTGQPLMFFLRLRCRNSTPRKRGNGVVTSRVTSHDLCQLLHSLQHFVLQPAAPLEMRPETVPQVNVAEPWPSRALNSMIELDIDLFQIDCKNGPNFSPFFASVFFTAPPIKRWSLFPIP